MLQKEDERSYPGVSRERWSVQWHASIPKADQDVGQNLLCCACQPALNTVAAFWHVRNDMHLIDCSVFTVGKPAVQSL